MTTNRLENVGLNLNPLEKTLRSNAPELERQFYRTRERSGIKFKLGHAFNRKQLDEAHYVITVWRKKKKMRTNNCKQFLRHNKTLNYF